MSPRNLLPILIAIVTLVSCGGDQKDRRSLLPGYIGQAGEVLVIMDKIHWEGKAGEAVREAFYQQAGVLPQYEPNFELTQYPHESFDRLLRPHRNILYVEIENVVHYKEPKVQVIREKYAKGQILVNCFAQSEDAFINKFSAVAASVIDKINEAEVERQQEYNQSFGEKTMDKDLAEKYGISLDIYPQANLKSRRGEFSWIHKVTARPKEGRMHDVQQGILIYQYPYTNDSTFTREFLLQQRDSLLKKYMPGPAPDSYMTTEYYYEPEFREFNLNGLYAVELRGLYKMENAFMGGPFVSVTAYNENTGKIVTVEGFVFAPKFDKREYLREVEAVVKSLSFVAADSTSTQE